MPRTKKTEEVVVHDVEVEEVQVKKPRKPRAKKVEAKTEDFIEKYQEVPLMKEDSVVQKMIESEVKITEVSKSDPVLTDFDKAVNARREEQQKKIDDYMKRSDAAVSKLPKNKQVYWRDRLNSSGTEETFLNLLAEIETHPARS